jgi:hypothetical protein
MNHKPLGSAVDLSAKQIQSSTGLIAFFGICPFERTWQMQADPTRQVFFFVEFSAGA